MTAALGELEGIGGFDAKVAGPRMLWACAKRLRCQKLLVENDQLVLGTGQPGDTNRVAPKHLGRNISWIIAGA